MSESESMSMPPGYRAEFAEEARKLALVGATDKEMAWHFEVPLETLHDWLASVSEFAQAVQYGRTLGDADVVEGFRQIAMGCFPEMVTRLVSAKKEFLTCIRHRPSNKAARSFWLMNRLPSEWCHRAEMEPDPDRGSVTKLTRSELQRLITGTTATPESATDG